MQNQFPKDHRDSYTEVKQTVGNTTVTSYYKVRDFTPREHADRELDNQFDPMTVSEDMFTDTAKWLSGSATAMRLVKYIILTTGVSNGLYVGAVMLVPLLGVFTYQYLRNDDDANKALVIWRGFVVLLGGLI